MMNKKSQPILVSIACPNRTVASTIAKALVEQKLAACAQFFPIQSVYRWDGKVQSEEEVLLQAKTMSSKLSALESIVSELHEYEVPELIATAIDWGKPAYLNWIKEMTD